MSAWIPTSRELGDGPDGDREWIGMEWPPVAGEPDPGGWMTWTPGKRAVLRIEGPNEDVQPYIDAVLAVAEKRGLLVRLS